MASAVTRSAYFAALSTVDTVTFSASGSGVDVVNLDGGGVIFVSVYPTSGGTALAASAANEMQMIPRAAGAHLFIPGDPVGKTYSCYASAATQVGLQVA